MPGASLTTRAANRIRRMLRSRRCRGKLARNRPIHVHVENRWRLGDEIMAIPFYELVRERYAGCTLTVNVNYPELLAGHEDLVVDKDRSEFACDAFIDARDDGRCEPRLKHLCSRFGIPYRHREPVLRTELPPPPLDIHGGARVLAYSCGAGWPCKSCDPGLMRELLRKVTARFPQTCLVELGKDCARAGVGMDRVDTLSILETAAVLSAASLYIGPDSGLVHLALSVGTPTLGLYGPVRPDTAFGIRRSLHALSAAVDCRGCWSEGRMTKPGVCPLGIASRSPSDYPCMASFTPDIVWNSITAGGLL